jgi:hypothetical protein
MIKVKAIEAALIRVLPRKESIKGD